MNDEKTNNHGIHERVAEHDIRLTQCESATLRLTQVCESLAETQQTISTAVQLLRQSHEEHERQERGQVGRLASDVSTLQQSSTMLKGGWLALCVIGAVIVGLAAVVGALVAVLGFKH